MTREELDNAHFIEITRGRQDKDRRTKFIVDRTPTSISTIDVHDGHTKETHEIIEKKNGETELSNTWFLAVAGKAQCMSHINLMLPVYQRARAEAETNLTRARTQEEKYENFKGLVAQTMNWPETPIHRR